MSRKTVNKQKSYVGLKFGSKCVLFPLFRQFTGFEKFFYSNFAIYTSISKLVIGIFKYKPLLKENVHFIAYRQLL